jgi:hypothetical protein
MPIARLEAHWLCRALFTFFRDVAICEECLASPQDVNFSCTEPRHFSSIQHFARKLSATHATSLGSSVLVN